jgi:hypothetical protein
VITKGEQTINSLNFTCNFDLNIANGAADESRLVVLFIQDLAYKAYVCPRQVQLFVIEFSLDSVRQGIVAEGRGSHFSIPIL